MNDAANPSFPKYEYVEYAYNDYCFGENGYADLSRIPPRIRDDYAELLDYYSPRELDMIRRELGDSMIRRMARSNYNYYRGNRRGEREVMYGEKMFV